MIQDRGHPTRPALTLSLKILAQAPSSDRVSDGEATQIDALAVTSEVDSHPHAQAAAPFVFPTISSDQFELFRWNLSMRAIQEPLGKLTLVRMQNKEL